MAATDPIGSCTVVEVAAGKGSDSKCLLPLRDQLAAIPAYEELEAIYRHMEYIVDEAEKAGLDSLKVHNKICSLAYGLQDEASPVSRRKRESEIAHMLATAHK